jgi:LDH2 family malate/lactate/ureidoglycolate dehydrogenase
MTPDELHAIVERIVSRVGTPPDQATIVADLLVGSHLAGHDSHGVQHLPRYIKEVQAGEIVPTARPEILRETPGTALVRGNWSWGHVTAQFVTDVGAKKALENGIALISAVEVNHIGRLGHYVERAAAQGVISLMVSGGHAEENPTAAPYGGSRALLAPNPIAIGFPSSDGNPVIIDFATTNVAGGKIALAKAKGEEVPLGWIIDKEGRPATNPDAYYDHGALLPFGAHKGFGIMVAIEILGRILAGSDDFSNTSHGGTYFRHVGISLVAIRDDVFSLADAFTARTGELVKRIRAVPPAPGFSEVMAPGDFEHRSRAQRSKDGIEIPESTWEELRETAASLDVTL